MAFHASLSLVAFSASVPHPIFTLATLLNHPTSFQSFFFTPAAFSFDHSSCHKIFQFLSSHQHGQKNVAWCLHFL